MKDSEGRGTRIDFHASLTGVEICRPDGHLAIRSVDALRQTHTHALRVHLRRDGSREV
jgi:hypothetical protein